MKKRITRIAVMPDESRLYGEFVTFVGIEDSAGGEYITVEQCMEEKQVIKLDVAEVDHVFEAIKEMVDSIKLNEAS